MRTLSMIALALCLVACEDRGAELHREALAKRIKPAWVQMIPRYNGTTTTVVPIHHPKRWLVLYRIEWELTEPTFEWISVGREAWQRFEVEIR